MGKDFAATWAEQGRSNRFKKYPASRPLCDIAAIEVNSRIGSCEITPISTLNLPPPVSVDSAVSKLDKPGTTM